MSAVTAFLLNADEEEVEDLASVGIDLNRPMSEPEIDAAASDMLGRMAWYDKQIAMANEAEALERERINARYERRRDPLVKRRADIEAQVLILAQRATFEGKKKSRNVGNGTFGVRVVPERVEVVDKAQALEWAKAHFAEAVQVETVEKLVHKAITPAVLARVHATGEVPDGFDVHPAGEAYYCRWELE